MVVIADRDSDTRRSIEARLGRLGCLTTALPDVVALRAALQRSLVDYVLLGAICVDPRGQIDLAKRIRDEFPQVRVAIQVIASSEETAIDALRAGACDYFRASALPEDVAARISDRLHRPAVVDAQAGAPSSAFVGDSTSIREVRAHVDRLARVDTNVLIVGETGVGKELIAQLIHRQSPRRRKPCICVNCAAIPDTLLESELFGYERGAFTGADRLREGKLAWADGGSIFFDEVGDMSPVGQAKILRAIESKEVHRLGGRHGVPVDVRVIAATNQNLERMVGENRFRKDLYYRLNVSQIHLPPLRERKGDLAPLLDFYVQQFNRVFGRRVEGFTPEALDCLGQHDWPGNVRELKNLVEAIYVNLNGHRITYLDLPEPFRRELERSQAMSQDEREMLLSALFATNWNKSRAAQELHWSRMTLYRKIAKYRVGNEPPSRRKTS